MAWLPFQKVKTHYELKPTQVQTVIISPVPVQRYINIVKFMFQNLSGKILGVAVSTIISGMVSYS